MPNVQFKKEVIDFEGNEEEVLWVDPMKVTRGDIEKARARHVSDRDRFAAERDRAIDPDDEEAVNQRSTAATRVTRNTKRIEQLDDYLQRLK